MNIGQQFLYSFYHLKKVSTFRIQKIGKPISYLFFLMFLTLIPKIISIFLTPTSPNLVEVAQLPSILTIPIFYLFTTSLKFIGVSFLAVIGLGIITWMKKPLQYKHTWTLSAYAVTCPTIVLAMFESFSLYIPFSWLLYWIIAILYLFLILRYIPKPKKRNP